MKRVAKVILANKDGEHLMLHRNDHPSFPNDPDLPGGMLETNEEPIEALMRELLEETGITLEAGSFEKLCESTMYDRSYIYYLYRASCEGKPDVSISWEHSRYEWLMLEDFIKETHTAVDQYMHMVYDFLTKNDSRLES